MIQRIPLISKSRSFFLFGPRQTGKSTYVRSLMGVADLYVNLLPQRIFLDYVREPNLFRQEVLSHQKKVGKFTCFVDEIQKIPQLLDEVHDLIESHGIHFVLTGSSARKLKRGAANLLAGRASTFYLYPLTYEELKDDFNLEQALQIGCLPYLWSNSVTEADQKDFLKSYTEVYLREEIQSEGIVRQIAPFTRFMDVVASNDAQIVNYSNIARECGVSVKTAQEYYQILEDTFIAHRVDPWVKSVRKRLISHSKYYLFDTGVTNSLCGNYMGLNSEARGRRFEQFLMLQLIALNHYHQYEFEYFFWRTHTGVEVDLILTYAKKPVAAIEIKSSSLIRNKDTYGLRAFQQEYPEVSTYIICPIERPRLLDEGVQVLPWQLFLTEELSKLRK